MTVATPTTPLVELTESTNDLLRAARREAKNLPELDLVHYLKRVLGRSLIACMTGIADANNVSRWVRPSPS